MCWVCWVCWHSVCKVMIPRTSSRAAKSRVMRGRCEENDTCGVGKEEGEGVDEDEDEGRSIESTVCGKRIEDKPIRVRDAESPPAKRVAVEEDIP